MERLREIDGECDSAADALDRLLVDRPCAVVAALSADVRLTDVPSSLRLGEHQIFDRTTGIDLIVPADQPHVLDAWRLAQSQPVVQLEVHLVAAPERIAHLHLFDLRAEHGVHVLVLDAPDPALVSKSVGMVEGQRRLIGRTRRDAVGNFLEVDAATSAILGWSAADLIGRRTTDLVHPDDIDRAIDAWMAMRAGTGNGRIQARYRHATGRYVWIEVTNEDRLDDPRYGDVVSELTDISEAMAELEALHDRERALHRIAEALPVGICHLLGDRSVAYSNAPMAALLGRVDSVDALVRSVAPHDRQGVQQAVTDALDGLSSDLEVGVLRAGVKLRCELTFRTMVGDHDGIEGVMVCAADVTERSRMRAELEHRASHDGLSGCLNRAATIEALERAMLAPTPVTVAYIDLDGFKAVNDELGHAAGDELLRVVAARLRTVTRGEDRLGRIGGDEFAVICPQGRDPVGVRALVKRLGAALNGSVTFGKQHIELRVSIGAVVSEPDDIDAETLLSRADDAMYAVKRMRQSGRTNPAA